jgi:hypothetical protein
MPETQNGRRQNANRPLIGKIPLFLHDDWPEVLETASNNEFRFITDGYCGNIHFRLGNSSWATSNDRRPRTQSMPIQNNDSVGQQSKEPI